jgi:hypothetical protein
MEAPQRLAQLNAMAITQMRSMLNAPGLKQLAGKRPSTHQVKRTRK